MYLCTGQKGEHTNKGHNLENTKCKKKKRLAKIKDRKITYHMSQNYM